MTYSHNLFSCLCVDIVGENRCWSFSGFKGLIFLNISFKLAENKKEIQKKKNYQEAQMHQTEEYQHGLYSGKLEKQ